jgi:hypothetical protein
VLWTKEKRRYSWIFLRREVGKGVVIQRQNCGKSKKSVPTGVTPGCNRIREIDIRQVRDF